MSLQPYSDVGLLHYMIKPRLPYERVKGFVRPSKLHITVYVQYNGNTPSVLRVRTLTSKMLTPNKSWKKGTRTPVRNTKRKRDSFFYC